MSLEIEEVNNIVINEDNTVEITTPISQETTTTPTVEVEAQVQKWTVLGDDIYIANQVSTLPTWFQNQLDNYVTNSSTLSTNLTTLQNDFSNFETGYNIEIGNINDNVSSLTYNLETLYVRNDTYNAGISNLELTKITSDEAISISNSTIAAWSIDPLGGGAWFNDKVSTIANDVSVQANSISSLGTQYNGLNITIDTVDTIAQEAHSWSAESSKLITSPEGLITGWKVTSSSDAPSNMTILADNFKLQDALNNYAIMTADGLSFYKSGAVEPFKMVSKIETGVALNNTTVSLTGFYKTPKIIVSQNTILAYDATHKEQSQKWIVRAENIQGDVVTGNWTFAPTAQLIIADNTSSESLNYNLNTGTDVVYSTEYLSPPETTNFDISGDINSYRSNGTSGQYHYRKCIVTLQTSATGVNWTSNTSTTVYFGSDLDSNTFNLNYTINQGQYYYRIKYEYSDDGTSIFTTSVSYDYYQRVVEKTSQNLTMTNASGGSSAVDVTYSLLPTEEIISGNFYYEWNGTIDLYIDFFTQSTSSASGYLNNTITSINDYYKFYEYQEFGSDTDITNGSPSGSRSVSTTSNTGSVRIGGSGYNNGTFTVDMDFAVIRLTLQTRIPIVTSTTPVNTSNNINVSFTLGNTVVLDNQGILNYLAIG